MADNLTKAQRSHCMSQVKGKDTILERRVRAALHARGLRFRKHVADLPGKPDIVFPRQRVVVFIDGDFWHGWRFPAWRDQISEFWQIKIEKNRQRDSRNMRLLRTMGWTVVRVWQHQIEQDCDSAIERIVRNISKPQFRSQRNY